MIKLFKYVLISICLLANALTFAQTKESDEKYLLFDYGTVGSSNIIKVTDSSGRKIYIFNIRYKLNKKKVSSISDNADFMFTFYIVPSKELKLRKILNPKKPQIVNLDSAKTKLLSAGYSDNFNFKPAIKNGNKYYTFENCIILGQAFDIQENSQYFPKYGLGSNRFELNLLSKPYSIKAIDSLRKVISKDMTSLVRFGIYIEDFYDKWFISNINRQGNTIDFWINLKTIHDSGFSFGRVTSEIRYKIGIGITDFKIIPFKSELTVNYFGNDDEPVQFNFKRFVDLSELF